jgi:hypothetical protein
MTKKLLVVVTIVLAFTIAAMAADVTGKWTYEQPGRGGGPGRPVTITLKQDGSKLTGSIPGFARGGGEAPAMEVMDGKVDGSTISFSTKMEMGGQTRVTKYEGTVEGETIKFKITREGQNGPVTTEVTAKRATT